jgi:hypothetical protein
MIVKEARHNDGFSLENPTNPHQYLIYSENSKVPLFMLP